MKVGIIGLGFVGSAMYKSFVLKGVDVYGWDKYKESEHTLEQVLDTDYLYLCLPTPFDDEINAYNYNALHETLSILTKEKFDGIVVVKSTVTPGTIDSFIDEYDELLIVHNPEFLTARTAFEDFHNQKHVVIGTHINVDKLVRFYNDYYPDAHVSLCRPLESESMKIFANSFYAMKVQIFTEFYSLCQKNGTDFDLIVGMIEKNGWLNPMHTRIPGPDGNISYGGACFPKDTNALYNYMKELDSPSEVLKATINERNEMRND